MKYVTCEGEFHPHDSTDSTKAAYLPEGSVILAPEEAEHFAFKGMPVYTTCTAWHGGTQERCGIPPWLLPAR